MSEKFDYKERVKMLIGRRIMYFNNSTRIHNCFTVATVEVSPRIGVMVSDGEEEGHEVFFTWAELECLDNEQTVEKTRDDGFFDYALLVEEKESEEEDVQVTRDFLEEKGLLTDSTEDDEPQDSEPTERKASDIVRECREAIENAFSDMIWNLCDHPVRPSVMIEMYIEKSRFLTALTRFEAVYKEMEGER